MPQVSSTSRASQSGTKARTRSRWSWGELKTAPAAAAGRLVNFLQPSHRGDVRSVQYDLHLGAQPPVIPHDLQDRWQRRGGLGEVGELVEDEHER